ncbi:MAG: UDP-N-acetylenolpyruvoylglucosamine reductase [Candidatus Andersenbacteria bacterium CG10_big_fil_rev_8_21_14_0_10_54_11]|uniref:UDP-N-acetylenolpyruvoylglucosamine reductase n=1 Tax=Candidatus Andersenbacteria bacterium CG10_big_fil_rev_8_21_14_0_10_54_11 TaxID=1974485 RepID=A0A2M6WZW5_9BACT|nr:MAG: UDP-N-acetylenolpyruvoylglucosamine reductase [Candidatus Andersenbacteria bacterium CG10_big_fil_rev_8_21_14_0_10_54_11]
MDKAAPLRLRRNVHLAPFTTIGLGGPAAYFADCANEQELVAALAAAANRGLPVHILGGGSNTIFTDTGYPGLVIRLALRGVSWQTQSKSTVLVTARAGEMWDDLVAAAVTQGLAGFECMSGIPGLVGATPIQNVGAYGQDVSQSIVSVAAMNRVSVQKQEFTNADCAFSYRSSRFKEEDRGTYIITDVTYQLQTNGQPAVIYPQIINELGGQQALARLGRGPAALQAVRQAVLTVRRRKSMVLDGHDPNTRSCGSFFVNPILDLAAAAPLQQRGAPAYPAGNKVKIPAAWLIEHAGYSKGYRRGGVGISANHPLALVNLGGTAAELLALAEEIQQRVLVKYGIMLEREPNLVS